MTTDNTDLLTDDEALRESAMTDGPRALGRWELRPTAALEISWLQRNKVLSPDMDVLWRSGAFAVIHSAPKTQIRAVVNDPARFTAAVDDWLDKNQPTAQEIADLQALLLERTNQYFAAFASTSAGTDSGN